MHFAQSILRGSGPSTGKYLLCHIAGAVLLAGVAQAQATYTISTVAGNGTNGYSGDGGQATAASIGAPQGAAVDSAGNLFIPERTNNRIRKVTPGGVITTIAGTGVAGFSGDGAAATSAQLNFPVRISLDVTGNLYFTDFGNNRIRKITPGGIITTVAGNGQQSDCGDGGQATSACLNRPNDVVLDSSGNLYISEGAGNVVRNVIPSGVITTLAGNGSRGYSGDGGPAAAAMLDQPVGIAATSNGTVFISDQGNYRIRKVTSGVITTVAGTGEAGFSGDGGLATNAKLSLLGSGRLDAQNNFYFPDNSNFRVRVLLFNGTIFSIAGNGSGGFSGDGGPATSASLQPDGLTVTPSGAIYVADSLNSRIRLLTPVGANSPAITPGGIVPIYSTVNTIQPGSWISIYGTNLATAAATWNGDFAKSLGGTSVTVNGKPAFLWFVSPFQLNVQAPDDTQTGVVSVVVTTPNGTATSTVMLAPVAPSFSVLDGKHVAGIILRSDGSGAYGGGTYDIAGPTGTSLGYKTVAAKAGDSLVLFGVGFGPTSPTVPAGAAYGGAAPANDTIALMINNLPVVPAFSGITGAGLFQMNLTVPSGLGSGDVPLAATVENIKTPAGVVLSVQ
jgi:uncharacterized protein (TIGR03437 family)